MKSKQEREDEACQKYLESKGQEARAWKECQKKRKEIDEEKNV